MLHLCELHIFFHLKRLLSFETFCISIIEMEEHSAAYLPIPLLSFVLILCIQFPTVFSRQVLLVMCKHN